MWKNVVLLKLIYFNQIMGQKIMLHALHNA